MEYPELDQLVDGLPGSPKFGHLSDVKLAKQAMERLNIDEVRKLNEQIFGDRVFDLQGL